ncbi:hypothetical protein Baya_3105 [Bagarius yarrelli]|uniref:Uncharacterized protein n=1 Tax=Bagarius yarrelli TaxID=175774 RepID=A0A556TUF7_BAGYA|nr:hypothetical protein Baya_3105 [Bagarius yarrelli]
MPGHTRSTEQSIPNVRSLDMPNYAVIDLRLIAVVKVTGLCGRKHCLWLLQPISLKAHYGAVKVNDNEISSCQKWFYGAEPLLDGTALGPVLPNTVAYNNPLDTRALQQELPLQADGLLSSGQSELPQIYLLELCPLCMKTAQAPAFLHTWELSISPTSSWVDLQQEAWACSFVPQATCSLWSISKGDRAAAIELHNK